MLRVLESTVRRLSDAACSLRNTTDFDMPDSRPRICWAPRSLQLFTRVRRLECLVCMCCAIRSFTHVTHCWPFSVSFQLVCPVRIARTHSWAREPSDFHAHVVRLRVICKNMLTRVRVSSAAAPQQFLTSACQSPRNSQGSSMQHAAYRVHFLLSGKDF